MRTGNEFISPHEFNLEFYLQLRRRYTRLVRPFAARSDGCLQIELMWRYKLNFRFRNCSQIK